MNGTVRPRWNACEFLRESHGVSDIDMCVWCLEKTPWQEQGQKDVAQFMINCAIAMPYLTGHARTQESCSLRNASVGLRRTFSSHKARIMQAQVIVIGDKDPMCTADSFR